MLCDGSAKDAKRILEGNATLVFGALRILSISVLFPPCVLRLDVML